MKFISHRGNTSGPNVIFENKPDYVLKTLASYDVEIDVWFTDRFYLGHDAPLYPIDLTFLKQDGLWCHAKSINTLKVLVDNGIHCFFHNIDDVVLTSRGYLWTYPGKEVCSSSIAVMPELADNWDYSRAYAYCSDYVLLNNKI